MSEVSYSTLATLVALYLGSVTTTQAIFRALSGQEEQPQLAVVISTLVIAALFNPLRRRIQAFIDRRASFAASTAPQRPWMPSQPNSETRQISMP